MSREIDRKIAELMGYNVRTAIGLLPEFSLNWNAMRLLVEWLQEKGLRVEIDILPDTLYCQIFQTVDCQWWSLTIIRLDESAPLALCKAVLSLPPEVLNHD